MKPTKDRQQKTTVFHNLPLLGILRGIQKQEVEFIAEVVTAEGLTALEVTMNTKDASIRIKELVSASKGRFSVGAGTVLCLEDLHRALDAGASFIVLPTIVLDVVEFCAKSGIPVFPGALTPGEIFNAWNAGATAVKVFPSNVFGSAYFRELRGPFNEISLMACGGVNDRNLKEFFEAGASSIAFGGSVFKREWMEKKDVENISKSIRALIQAYTAFTSMGE